VARDSDLQVGHAGLRWRKIQSLTLTACTLMVLVATIMTAARAQETTPAQLPMISAESGNPRTLITGVGSFPPYQFFTFDGLANRATGLDVDLVNAVFQRMGFDTNTATPTAWAQQLTGVAEGRQDYAAGAFFSEERAEYANYSIPYRVEENVIYVRRGEYGPLNFDNREQLFELIEAGTVKLGRVSSWITADHTLNSYLSDAAYSSVFVESKDEAENFQKLLDGQVDGILTLRLTASTLAWNNGFQHLVEQHPNFYASEPVHVIFSKKSVDPDLVAKFDATLLEMQKDGSLRRTVRKYLLPVLMEMTVQTNWFFLVSVIGTIAFAISGLILAYRESYSFFGACILAGLPALGGGALRDIIVGRSPLAILASPIYIYIVLITVISGFFLVFFMRLFWKDGIPPRLRPLGGMFSQSVLVSDAVGLAAFTVTGVLVAIEVDARPLWLWSGALAVLTAAGGGILRDIVRSDPNISTLKTELYPEVALVWGVLLSVYLTRRLEHLVPVEILVAVVVTMVGVLATRLAAYRWKIHSPSFALIQR
jgi:polar amino acid transport system substrate-binding protein